METKKQAEEIGLQTLVQRDPKQVYSSIDDEIVMLSLKNGQYFSLNTVASRIWMLIDKPIKVQEVIDVLLVEFEVDKGLCETDTLSCIRDFRIKSLLKDLNE